MRGMNETRLRYFKDFEAQDRVDLAWGGQHLLCQKHLDRDTDYRDPSITGSWRADED
jgi:hypothetical protein